MQQQRTATPLPRPSCWQARDRVPSMDMTNVAAATSRDHFSMRSGTKSSDPSWNIAFSVYAQLIKHDTPQQAWRHSSGSQKGRPLGSLSFLNTQLQEDRYGLPRLFLEVWRGAFQVKKTQLYIFPSHFVLLFKSEIKWKNEKSVGIQKVMPKHKRKPSCGPSMESVYERALGVLVHHCV